MEVQIVRVLEQVQREGGTSSEVAQATGLPRAAVSAYLGSLSRAGCIAREKVPDKRTGRPAYHYRSVA